jgi:6-phosphogluconolactonase
MTRTKEWRVRTLLPFIVGLTLAVSLLTFSRFARSEVRSVPGKSSGLDKLWVYVGTYTGRESKGIYRFEFDPANGKLTDRQLVAVTENPSFLAIAPSRRFLYAVNEVERFKGKHAGAISAYALDPQTGALTALNQQSTGGAGPCHLVVDQSGKNVLAANYSGGSVCVMPIEADGRLGEATCVVQHHGSGANADRQAGPHAHCINLDAANRYALSADLGLDKVLVYHFDGAKGTLTPNDPPSGAVAPGAGPRHLAFHPNGRLVYVIDELNSTVTAFHYDPTGGVLKSFQTLSTLPKDYTGKSYCAEVHVHPSGKFLYGSNRGHDSIAIFSIDPKSGQLTSTGFQSHGIKTPRDFDLDPSGKFLLVGNQDSDSVSVFRVNMETGALTPVGEPAAVSKPVCVKMMPQMKG